MKSLYSLHSLPEAVRLAEKEAARRRSRYGEEHPKSMQLNVTASDDVANWAVSKLSGPRAAVDQADRAVREELHRLALALKDPQGVPSRRDLHFFVISGDEEIARRMQQSAPQILTSARPPIRAYCRELCRCIDEAATFASLMLNTTGAYNAWETYLERSLPLWQAWWAVVLELGLAGAEPSVLRRLQGLFAQRVMHALVAELLRRHNADRKGEREAEQALRVGLKGRAAAHKRGEPEEAAEEEADGEGHVQVPGRRPRKAARSAEASPNPAAAVTVPTTTAAAFFGPFLPPHHESPTAAAAAVLWAEPAPPNPILAPVAAAGTKPRCPICGVKPITACGRCVGCCRVQQAAGAGQGCALHKPR